MHKKWAGKGLAWLKLPGVGRCMLHREATDCHVVDETDAREEKDTRDLA